MNWKLGILLLSISQRRAVTAKTTRGQWQTWGAQGAKVPGAGLGRNRDICAVRWLYGVPGSTPGLSEVHKFPLTIKIAGGATGVTVKWAASWWCSLLFQWWCRLHCDPCNIRTQLLWWLEKTHAKFPPPSEGTGQHFRHTHPQRRWVQPSEKLWWCNYATAITSRVGSGWQGFAPGQASTQDHLC